MRPTRRSVESGLVSEMEYAEFRRVVNAYQAERRFKTKNADTKKYEKTINGYLVRTYRNMKSRCAGIVKRKAHLYAGLEILTKEDFYSWSLRDSAFKNLLCEYKESGFDFKKAPSIDRIDPSKGYTIENIRWISHSENSRLGSVSRNRRRGKTEVEI